MTTTDAVVITRLVMIEFFMPMIPPTVTAQEHEVTVVNGKPRYYDPPRLKAARNKLTGALTTDLIHRLAGL